MPAPPPESEPAMVMAVRGLITVASNIRGTVLGSLIVADIVLGSQPEQLSAPEFRLEAALCLSWRGIRLSACRVTCYDRAGLRQTNDKAQTAGNFYVIWLELTAVLVREETYVR